MRWIIVTLMLVGCDFDNQKESKDYKYLETYQTVRAGHNLSSSHSLYGNDALELLALYDMDVEVYWSKTVYYPLYRCLEDKNNSIVDSFHYRFSKQYQGVILGVFHLKFSQDTRGIIYDERTEINMDRAIQEKWCMEEFERGHAFYQEALSD